MWWRRDRKREQQRKEQQSDNLGSEKKVSSRRGAGFWFWVLLGAAAILSLRRRILNFEQEFGQPGGGIGSSGTSYGTGGGSQQYSRAAQESQRQTFKAHIDELLRRERIRRMQEAFARAREAYARTSDQWQRTNDPWQQHPGTTWEWRWDGHRWEGHPWEGNPWGGGGNPWGANPFEWTGEQDYWKAGSRDQQQQQWRTHEKPDYASSSVFMSQAKVAHHLGVLGLDPNRGRQYSGAEIKAAFRARAKEYHPDHNQSGNKQAEVKFKQILESYQALRTHYKIK